MYCTMCEESGRTENFMSRASDSVYTQIKLRYTDIVLIYNLEVAISWNCQFCPGRDIRWWQVNFWQITGFPSIVLKAT